MRNVQGRKKAKLSTGSFSSFIYLLIFSAQNNPIFQNYRLVGDSGTVLRREVRGGDARTGKGGDQDEGEAGEVGTVRRGRGGKGERGLGRRHSRASSLDRREIYQKYIHTDRSVRQFCIATARLILDLT